MLRLRFVRACASTGPIGPESTALLAVRLAGRRVRRARAHALPCPGRRTAPRSARAVGPVWFVIFEAVFPPA